MGFKEEEEVIPTGILIDLQLDHLKYSNKNSRSGRFYAQ